MKVKSWLMVGEAVKIKLEKVVITGAARGISQLFLFKNK